MTVCRTIPVQTVCNSLVPHHGAHYPSSPHQIDPHRSGAIQTGPSLAVPSTDADQGAGMLAVSKDHLYRSPTLQSLQVTFNGRVKYSFKAIQRHVYGGMLRELEAAAPALGVRLQIATPRGPEEFEAAFGSFRHEGAGAVVVFGSEMVAIHRKMLADLSLKHRLPAIYQSRAHVR